MTITPNPKPYRFFTLMSGLVMAELTCSLESGMIYAALSGLYREFGDPVGVGWLLTAFTLASAASAALAGRLGDMFGRRRVMLVMLLIAFCGSVLSATSSDLTWIVVGRAIQGVSMAILPLGFGVLRENVPSGQIGLGVSIIGTTYTVGGGIGILVGGLIIDFWHWQGIFAVSAIMAMVSIALVVAFVPDTPPQTKSRSIDIIGGALFAPAVALILYALTEGSGRDWTRELIGGLILGGAMLAYWFQHEWRRANPLIDVRLLGKREVALANLNLFIIALGPLLSPAIIIPFLQQPVWTGVGFGLAATAAAFVKLPGNALSVAVDVVGGILTKRFAVRSIMLPAAIANVLGWLALYFGHHSFWVSAAAVVLLIVPATSLLLVMTPQIIIQASPDDRTSEATGLTQVIRAFGKALGVQIIAFCFATSLIATPDGKGSFPDESAYELVFMACVIFSVISLCLILALPRGRGAQPIGVAAKPAHGL